MSSNSERLGKAVLKRRNDLDLSQLDVHAGGGPSNTSLTKIENGLLETLTRVTARKLDAGLQWEQGSAKAVWNGGEPTPLGAVVIPADVLAELDKVSPETRAYILRELGADTPTISTERGESA